MPENKVLSYIVTSTMGARDFSCAVSGFGQVFIAIHFATHGFVLRTAILRPKLNIPLHIKKKVLVPRVRSPQPLYCWCAHDVTAAMLVVKNKSISLLWDVNFNSCKFFEKIYCFDLQHGRLLTWLKTKNIVPYAPKLQLVHTKIAS